MAAVDPQADYEKFLVKNETHEGRPAALHQLTLNGSMLLATNHDPAWLYWLGWITDREPSTWRHMSRSLRACPGDIARKALWRASFMWWRERVTLLPDIVRFSFDRLGDPGDAYQNETARLTRVEQYLRETRWCEQGQPPRGVTGPSTSEIEVVES